MRANRGRLTPPVLVLPKECGVYASKKSFQIILGGLSEPNDKSHFCLMKNLKEDTKIAQEGPSTEAVLLWQQSDNYQIQKRPPFIKVPL